MTTKPQGYILVVRDILYSMKLWWIHPSRDFGRKTLADGDNKSFLLVHNELIVAWLHGDASMMPIYSFSVEWFVTTTNAKLLVPYGQTPFMQGNVN